MDPEHNADAAPSTQVQVLLTGLRSGGKLESEHAVAAIYDELRGYADAISRPMLGAKRDRADLNPESVVLSVLGGQLGRVVVRCNSDEHLLAFLKVAVKHKYLDRLKSRQSRNADDDLVVPASGPGPATHAFLAESAMHDIGGYSRLVDVLKRACSSDADEVMVGQFLLADKGWSAVAEQLNKKVSAAKVAFHRLRENLLIAAIGPLEQVLPPAEWRVARAVCIERLSPASAAEMLDIPEDTLRQTFQSRVLPELRALYGSPGVSVIHRLMGTPKKQPSGGG